jgi:flagellar hook-basal body complex protein FliE
MKVGQITGQIIKTPQLNEITKTDDKKFENVFTDLIKNVSSDQNKASRLTEDFINGEDVELHEVMIAGQKAKTSLELLTEIRNKSIDMYKELTRMQ